MSSGDKERNDAAGILWHKYNAHGSLWLFPDPEPDEVIDVQCFSGAGT